MVIYHDLHRRQWRLHQLLLSFLLVEHRDRPCDKPGRNPSNRIAGTLGAVGALIAVLIVATVTTLVIIVLRKRRQRLKKHQQ